MRLLWGGVLLAELAFLASFALSASPQVPAPVTQDQREAEIRELHQELNALSARLSELESQERVRPDLLCPNGPPDLRRSENRATAAILVKF